MKLFRREIIPSSLRKIIAIREWTDERYKWIFVGGNQFPYRNSRCKLQLRWKHRKLQNSIKRKIVFKIQAKIFLLTDRKLELRRQVSHSKITTQLLHDHNTITTVETSHISRKTFMVELKSRQEMIAEINYHQRSGDDQQRSTGKKKTRAWLFTHPPAVPRNESTTQMRSCPSSTWTITPFAHPW